MRVLLLEASAGRVVGGSLTGMLHMVAGLDRSRYEPVVVLYEDKPVIADLEADGVEVHVFRKRKLPKQHALQQSSGYRSIKTVRGVAAITWNLRAAATFMLETVPAALRLVPLFRRIRPDVVHTCNGFRGNMDAVVAARMCGIPVVVHSKGFDKVSVVERAMAPGVAAVISMTKVIEDHNRAVGLRPRAYHVVYDGLDLGSFSPVRSVAEVRDELGIAEDAPAVGVVGHIQDWKGQRVLLEAMPRVLASVPGAVAVVIGGVHKNGEAYAESMHAFVREHGLESSVVFTGERDDVPDLMLAMNVVAHTSVRGEPFGRVIIEGMSVGRPVVATRAGGVPEFVRDGEDGILVEPGDADELADVLIDLFENPARVERMSAGALRGAERFRIDNHVREVCAIYEEVVGGRAAA